MSYLVHQLLENSAQQYPDKEDKEAVVEVESVARTNPEVNQAMEEVAATKTENSLKLQKLLMCLPKSNVRDRMSIISR